MAERSFTGADPQMVEHNPYLREGIDQIGDQMRIPGAEIEPEYLVLFSRMLPDTKRVEGSDVDRIKRITRSADRIKPKTD